MSPPSPHDGSIHFIATRIHSAQIHRLPVQRLRTGFMSFSPTWLRRATLTAHLGSPHVVTVLLWSAHSHSTHVNSIVHTSRLKVFQLSQALRSDDWETVALRIAALPCATPHFSSLRLIALLLESSRFPAFPRHSPLSLLNSTTKNCTFNFLP